MKRYKYGMNFFTLNSAKFFQVLPLGYIDCAPGDTISGKVTSSLISDTLVKPLMNRTYHDLYAFYIPYRLLMDDFPAFISENDSGGFSIPVLSTDFEQNFENTGVASHASWQRFAYNMVLNTFFRYAGETARATTLATLGVTPNRPSTIMESFFVDTDISDQTAASLKTDDIRTAFAQDRFQKTRDFYGDKYTDYLAAVGVEASWSILDEPEIIGMKNTKLGFRTSTSGTQAAVPAPGENLGDPAGTFRSTNTLSLKRTFCPEHGLILVVGIAKMDLINLDTYGPLLMTKTARKDYYSPEFETSRVQDWDNPALGLSAGTSVTPVYEDYRKGQNLFGQNGAAEENYFATMTTTSVAGLKKYDPDDLDEYMQGTMDANKATHYSVKTDFRCQRLSAVRPAQSVHGVA